jgi:ribose 5-phosphate isomerase RpiB
MGGSVRRPSPLHHEGASLVLDQLTLAVANEILEAWFATPYSDDEWNRQQMERIKQIEDH